MHKSARIFEKTSLAQCITAEILHNPVLLALHGEWLAQRRRWTRYLPDSVLRRHRVQANLGLG